MLKTSCASKLRLSSTYDRVLVLRANITACVITERVAKFILFEALIANAVFLCDADALLHWNSAAEEGAWVGLKPDLQGGTRFNLLRVQFWTPVQRKRI